MTIPERNRLLGVLIAMVTLAVDQIAKWAMLGPLNLREVGQVNLLPIFAFTWSENRGVSLGLLTAGSDLQRWGLVALTALIAAGVVAWLVRERRLGDIAPLGLILGGALGNIVDRVRLGFVIDYLDLHFGDFRPFLIFNLADAAITIGVLIVLARSFLSREKRPRTEPADPGV